MITSRKFKDSFQKSFSVFTEDLLQPETLRRIYKNSFKKEISKEKCKNSRENAVKFFKEAVEEEFNKMCETYKIEEHLVTRDQLTKEQKERARNSGWRPSGDAVKDTFGDRRETQASYIKDMKDFAAELEQQLKESQKALKDEHRMLKQEVAEFDM